jgi:alpha-L-rhamnosidase
MNSQNHVMLLGDLLIWMYEDLAGIKSDRKEVGYKKIIMRPNFVDGLTYVNASYYSPHGKIQSNWKKESGQLKWDIAIPANTTAIIYIPAKNANDVKSPAEGVKFLKLENGNAIFEIGHGDYSFTSIIK